MKKRIWRNLLVSICFSLMLLGWQTAQADVEIKDLGTAIDSASIGFDQFLFYRFDSNPFYGLEMIPGESDTNFGEIFSRLRFTFEKDIKWSKVVAQFALVYESTIDQNMYFTAKDEGDLDVNQAWIQFQKLFGSPFDITLGEQDVKIEKQLLVGIGKANLNNVWLNQDQSFPFAVKLDGNFGAFKTNLYWAKAEDYWQKFDEGYKDDVEVAGLNLHYDISENTYVYGGIVQKIDNSDQAQPGGSDTTCWDFGVNAGVGNFLFEGEVVYQTGDAGEVGGVEMDRDAIGGFLSATYTFPVKFSPFIRLTYDYFSGDDDLTDDDAETFDPMFYGFPGWERWIIGEVAGELHLTNSNRRIIIADVGFNPVPGTTVTLMYMNTTLDEENYLGVPVTADDWSDEVNLFIDCFPNDHLYLHLGFGYSKPGDAAEEVYGDDDEIFVQALIGFFL